MIENEDSPTVQRTVSQQGIGDATANSQVSTATNTDIDANTISTSSPAQQAPQPAALPYMTVEDVLALKIASEPQISPDGTLMAYTVLQCNGDTNATSSAIWLVDSGAGKDAAPVQLTSGEYHDTAPRWSPDGHTLAFLSDRSGSPQLHLLSMSGGEAHLVATLPQGVTEYSWRPDGQALLAHSAWKPSDDTQKPLSGSTPDIDIYTRLDDHWDECGYKQKRYQQLWLIALNGEVKRLTAEPVDLLQSAWSPNGAEIAFCTNRRPDPDTSVSMALWVLTLATGQLRRLTPEDGLAQMPAWSPDGQTLAYLYSPDQSETSNIVPWIVPARDMNDQAAAQSALPQQVSAQLTTPGAELLNCQAWIIDEQRSEYLMPPQWFPDSNALLVASQERGQVHLYRIDIQAKQVTRLTSGNGRYISPQLSANGDFIACVRADWFTPGDIWSMDSAGKNPHKLTGVNDAVLHNRLLIRPKRITWQSFDGLEIEAWLYLPLLSGQARAPLILVPHGGPSLAWGDCYVHEFQVLAGRGYAVLAPNPRGSTGYGEDFCRKALNDWGGADFRDLMAGVDHVSATEPIDDSRLGIGGISYGGYMTTWAITQTGRFKAAVSRNGISSLVTASALSDQTIWFNLSMDNEALQHSRSALTFAERITTPLLLLHGENDLRCPFSESLQLFVALRKRKQPVELVRYRNASHLMDWPNVGTPQQRVDRLRRTITWFERYV